MFNPFDLIVTLRSVENSKRKILSRIVQFSVHFPSHYGADGGGGEVEAETSVRDVLFGPAATMNIFNAEYYCATEQKILIHFEWEAR